MPACTAPGCPSSAVSKGYCNRHYHQARTGRPFSVVTEPEVCTFPDCGRPLIGRGYCQWHMKQSRQGIPLTPIQDQREGCLFPECPHSHRGLGYCDGHYQQLRSGRELGPLRQGSTVYETPEGWVIRAENGALFRISAEDVEKARGLCWTTHAGGYAAAYVRGGSRKSKSCVLLHRYLLEPHENEQVDHISGDRSDNRRCNLRLATAAQNAQNLGVSKANTSGVRGVSFDQARQKWRAAVKLNGKQRSCRFDTKEEAEAAALALQRELFEFVVEYRLRST